MKKEKKIKLSNKRALEVLKFLVKKKLGAEEADWKLLPFHSMAYNFSMVYDGDDGDYGDWCRVSADVTFKDGKGFRSSIMVAYRGYRTQELLEVSRATTTWTTLLRKMEREANCLKKAAFFSLHGCNIFESGDSIERILVEMTLENWRI